MAEYKGDRLEQQLGPYRLIRLLGAGGFGEVYEADHQLLLHKRAIKLLLERHFHDPNQRERFLREARTLATLEHPNILPVLEVGEEGNMLYLVMPFYRRGTLNDLLKQRTTPLPLVEVERLLAQMCAAVGYAHARHIAHLDLKPDNMLLHEDGRLVLSDFGLAHLIEQGRLEAGSSASWGTPYYMAPEQIQGQPGQRSDLYALGIILYQLLTNQHPFAGIPPQAVMLKHLLEAPPPLHAASPAAPATLEPVIQKALGKKPEDRYATAEVLLADFRAAVSSPSPQPAQPSTPPVFSAAPASPRNDSAPVAQPTSLPSSEYTPHLAKPANIMQTTGVGCEIRLEDGRYCSISAIGRCATCGYAFCLTHQAYKWDYYHRPVPYVDKCASCFANAKSAGAVCQIDDHCDQIPIGRCATCGRVYCNIHQGSTDGGYDSRGFPLSFPCVDKCADCREVEKRAEQAKYEAERERQRKFHNEISAAETYIRSGAARVALLTSGVPSVEIHWYKGEMKKGLFGHYWGQTRISMRGWILGEFKWEYNDGGNYGGNDVVEDCLTALLDLSHDDQLYRNSRQLYYNHGLARVRPYSGGYEVLSLVANDRFVSNSQSGWGCIAVARAVKRLTGESS